MKLPDIDLTDEDAFQEWWMGLTPDEQRTALAEAQRIIDTPMYVHCDLLKRDVLACACGPHERCPEHAMNCVPEAEERGLIVS